MQNMNIEQWYTTTVGTDTPNAVAENSGIVVSSLWRQLPDKLSPKNVVKIAHAYSVPALDGLVALGLISDEDIAFLRSNDALKDATDDQLLQELARRLADQHDMIVDDPASAWNMPVGVRLEPAASHDKRKGQAKGVDEEYA